MEDIQDIEIVEEDVDNARDLTSGVVITPTVVLIMAIVPVLMALGDLYEIGPFSGN